MGRVANGEAVEATVHALKLLPVGAEQVHRNALHASHSGVIKAFWRVVAPFLGDDRLETVVAHEFRAVGHVYLAAYGLVVL